MTKTKEKQSKRKQRNGASGGAAAATGRQKRKREVQVVVCPSAFPDFTTVGGSTTRRQEQQRGIVASGRSKHRDNNRRESNNADGEPPALDVQETIREVHRFGAEGFTGVQKKSYTNAEYERLTGRTAKRQKIPTKIVIGMRKKALKREERQKQELKESGVVSHHPTSSSSQRKKKNDKTKAEREGELGGGLRGIFGSNRARNTGDRRKTSKRMSGPAPDMGFMLKGMLKVKQPDR